MNIIIKKKTLLVTIGVISMLGFVSFYNMDFIKSAFAFAEYSSKGNVNESELAETYGGFCGLCVWIDAWCNVSGGEPGCEWFGDVCRDEHAICKIDGCSEMGTECQWQWPTYECGDIPVACTDTYKEYECVTTFNLETEEFQCECLEKLSINCSEHTSEGKVFCDKD